MKPAPVLFINTWYPNREDPWLGLFIRKHARALSKNHPVISLYTKSASVSHLSCDWEEAPGYLALKAYYPRLAGGVPVVGPLIRAFAYPWYTYRAWKILRQKAGIQKPACVVMNVAGPLAWLAVFLKIQYSVPLYWLEHWNAFLPGDSRYSGLHIRLQARILHLFSTSTATVSAFLAQGMKAHGLGKKISIIPNVVDEAFFRNKPRPVHKRLHLAHISNFAPFKQADKILDALHQVLSVREDFSFDFMGLDSPAKDALKQKARDLGLFPGRVDFLPPLPEHQMPEYLATLDGVVSYSTMESQGVVLLEAWACGLPVIANANMGAWENGPEDGKILADPQNLQSLVNALHYLLDHKSDFSHDRISQEVYHQVSEEAVGAKLFQWLNLT